MSARPFCSFPEKRWDRRLFPVSPRIRSRSSRPRRREAELRRSPKLLCSRLLCPRLLSRSRAPLVSSPASGLPIQSNLSHIVLGEESLAAGKAIWLEEQAQDDGAVGRHRLVPVA